MKQLSLKIALIMVMSPLLPSLLAAQTKSNVKEPTKEEDEKKPRKRRETVNTWGFGFGPYKALNMGTDSVIYSVAATNHREVSDQGEVRFRIGAGSADDGAAQQASVTVGGAFVPLPGEISPVVGAEFGFGLARGSDVKSTAGFTGAILAGVRLFRSTSTQMEIVARFESMTKENKKGHPQNYGLDISIVL